MLFNSLTFLIFIAIVLLIYPLLSHKKQNYFLLVASYVFYGWWDWRFLFLLAISTIVDFFCAKKIQQNKRPKRYVAISVLTNLSILGFFKYFNFFADSLQRLFEVVGFQMDPVTLNIILPVGISFYTFQSLSYTIDVYRKQISASNDIVDVALYVSFFPQLVAGPIERASHFPAASAVESSNHKLDSTRWNLAHYYWFCKEARNCRPMFTNRRSLFSARWSSLLGLGKLDCHLLICHANLRRLFWVYRHC